MGKVSIDMNIIRALIRPVSTLILLLAYVVYAHYDASAFERVKELTLVAVSFYFGVRTNK